MQCILVPLLLAAVRGLMLIQGMREWLLQEFKESLHLPDQNSSIMNNLYNRNRGKMDRLLQKRRRKKARKRNKGREDSWPVTITPALSMLLQCYMVPVYFASPSTH